MVLLLAILVAETGLDLLPPLITKHIIDDVLIPTANFPLLVWLVAGLFGLRVLAWGTAVGRRWVGAWVGFRAIEKMRADLYRALMYLPLRFYDKRKVGALISRMSNDSDLVEIYLIFDIPYIISNGLMVVGILGVLGYMSWELTLWGVAARAPHRRGIDADLEPHGSLLGALVGEVVTPYFSPERVHPRDPGGQGLRPGAA